MTPIAEEFKGRRKLLGTQSQAAAELGICLRYVQRLEAAHAVPSTTVMKLLRLLTPQYQPAAPARRRR